MTLCLKLKLGWFFTYKSKCQSSENTAVECILLCWDISAIKCFFVSLTTNLQWHFPSHNNIPGKLSENIINIFETVQHFGEVFLISITRSVSIISFYNLINDSQNNYRIVSTIVTRSRSVRPLTIGRSKFKKC